MGVSFVFSMHLETQASRQFSASTQARYAAEAGVSHAWALLDEDRLGSRVDDLIESWVTQMAGSETDVDDSGAANARWWLLMNNASQRVGRYAVLIKDETSKVNLNTALADPQAAGVDAVNLTTLLTQLGVPQAANAAQAIERYRYGPNERPGVALVDDDRDGVVDEPDEYQPLALRGDDRRFESLEELLSLGVLEGDWLKRLAAVATVYSWDPNLTLAGQPRVNLNTATAEELLNVLLETGVENPWQLAANMADYADSDLAFSKLSKVAASYDITSHGDLGDWHWQDAPQGHYETTVASGQSLSWQVAVPTGTFRVLVHGITGLKVGDVDIEGQSRHSMNAGESFGVLALGGTVTVRVTHREAAGTTCAFRGLELVPTETGSGLPAVVVRGIEAVRFNEVMVNPVITLPVTEAVFDPQTSGWACPVNASSCSNSGTGQARWSWTSPFVQPGHYYVRVFGAQAGQTVGEVHVDGQSALLVQGQRHPSTMTVGSDRKISLTIGKTPADGTYYFQEVELSVKPDAEYVELINLSGQDIDVSGWTIEGEATRGRQARMPAGSVIKAHGLLVAAVDADDRQAGLSNNDIDVRTAWEVPADIEVVQLEFPGGELNPDADWLSVTLPANTNAQLMLRASDDAVVDEVEYRLPLVTTAPFQSLEKGDPSVVVDADKDGLDDGWYPALELYTPGTPNDNEGLRELQGLQQIVHDPSKELTVLNRPLRSIGELAGLPSGQAWHVVSTDDLAKVVDQLTVEGLRLETEGRLIDGQTEWHETAEGYETSREGAIGTWQWRDVPDGQYRLSLYGWSGEQLSVRWQAADGTYNEWIPTRSTDEQGRILVGQITVGLGASESNTCTLQVRCDSPGGVCHVNHIWLDPQLTRVGPININTAPREVLLTLPGMTDLLAQRLIAGRPYGDQEHKTRGIGDLLLGSVLGEAESDRLERFRQLGHLITVRSEVFQIMSVGEALEREKPVASKRVQTILQR